MDDQAIEREVKWLDRQYAARVAWALDESDHEDVWRALAARCCRRLNGDETSRRLARSARKKVLRRYKRQVSGHAYYAEPDALCCLRTCVGEDRRKEAGECMLQRALWLMAALAPCMQLLKGDAALAYGDPRLSCRLTPEEEALLRP